MCASSRARGVPDVSQCVERSRLSCRIQQGGSRVCLLVAPSGYGKSVAAAQFALRHQLSVWIDASNGSVRDGRSIAQETLSALRTALPEWESQRVNTLDGIQLVDLVDAIETTAATFASESICVVVDDIPAVCVGDAVRIARRIGASLRDRVRFVFTARDVSGAEDEIVRNCTVLGADDLRLNELEAAELHSSSSNDASIPDTASALRAECNGHVALFSVLSRNLGNGADAPGSSAVNTSLELWLEHLLGSQLSETERRLAAAMALLKSGTAADLKAIGVSFTDEDMTRILMTLPLIAFDSTPQGRREFRVHDSVVDFWIRHDAMWLECSGPEMVRRSVPVLTNKGNLVGAALVLARVGDVEACASWLLENGSSLLDGSHSESLLTLLDLIPLSVLFSQPKLLLLSAAVATQAEQYEDALARSRAALSLAEHCGDLETKVEAISRVVHCMCNLGQFNRASELSADLMGQPLDKVAHDTAAAALLALGIQAAARGEFAESERALSRVRSLVGEDGRNSRTGMLACLFASILPGLAQGDFRHSALLLAPFLDCEHLWLTDRLSARGNLAVCLCEIGKLERSRLILRELLDRAFSAGLRSISGCFLPTLGCVEAGLGSVDEGLRLIEEGIRLSLEVGDEQSAQVNRVYLATVFRANGALEESLMQAERAFEHLSVVDVFRCRRLAAIEVAATFLSLEDVSAARAWVQVAIDEPFEGNQYHELRVDMVLAEIARREGRLDEARKRLAKHADHISSGNSNWQVAMYCRSFPFLLAMVADAVGVDRLPEHFLKLIPAEHAERALLNARSVLSPGTWRALGLRILDAVALDRLESGDSPICHVRLFGGLEVSIGGRTIRERDWRKRKARTLFVMLAARRGQDIPRDQLIEHLWPEMDEERAKNNLYVAWSTMKSVLGGEGSAGVKSPYVDAAHGVCRVMAGAVRSDVDEFEEALVRAGAAAARKDVDSALSAYEQVAAAYRGDLLPGDVYDDWFDGVRSHYRSTYIDAMQTAATFLLERGDGINGLAFVRRAIQADRLREDLYQVQMRCQIQACQRSAAIDTYFQCIQLLSDELGLDPSAETRALYDEILAMESRPPSFGY